MKKFLFVIMLSIFLFGACFAQQYHYPFGYNFSDLNRLDDAFFEELEKDLGRTIAFDNLSPGYSYIQHLKNKSLYFALRSNAAELNEEDYYLHLKEMIARFPTQTSGYYNLARNYMEKGEVEEAINVLKKAALEYNVSPVSFSYLAKLYAENDEFISGYNDLLAYYPTAETTELPDSNWITLYDSIRQQDQLYRGKYRFDDPCFEPQYQIDEQNALFLRELVREHGWVSKLEGQALQAHRSYVGMEFY
ncbi:MAG: hypothetical protein EA361_17205 [Bacteroidetes bacterium]|nr:MAG: hypothetical protein EA361_17205 [Bacteroidota bacterium]